LRQWHLRIGGHGGSDRVVVRGEESVDLSGYGNGCLLDVGGACNGYFLVF
jgi:hypothetical protein